MTVEFPQAHKRIKTTQQQPECTPSSCLVMSTDYFQGSTINDETQSGLTHHQVPEYHTNLVGPTPYSHDLRITITGYCTYIYSCVGVAIDAISTQRGSRNRQHSLCFQRDNKPLCLCASLERGEGSTFYIAKGFTSVRAFNVIVRHWERGRGGGTNNTTASNSRRCVALGPVKSRALRHDRLGLVGQHSIPSIATRKKSTVD
jgi:hypothetical protein